MREHPRKVFHGVTQNEIEASTFGQGKDMVFLAHDWSLAETYADESGLVFDVEDLSVNPLILATPEEFRDAWIGSGAHKNGGKFHPDCTGKLAEWARAKGHDAIVIPSSAFEGELGYEWAAGTVGEPQTIVLDASKVRVTGQNRVSVASVGAGR